MLPFVFPTALKGNMSKYTTALKHVAQAKAKLESLPRAALAHQPQRVQLDVLHKQVNSLKLANASAKLNAVQWEEAYDRKLVQVVSLRSKLEDAQRACKDQLHLGLIVGGLIGSAFGAMLATMAW